MAERLAGRAALVTGGGRGMGVSHVRTPWASRPPLGDGDLDGAGAFRAWLPDALFVVPASLAL
ncbi:hypothetical protein [Mycobacterium lacus]|uniref:Uncharacterized protein n=1 Tax=Mycobacterium lacus TaxID=169765 RepID=A0A7I7NME2_9MYCO|nr:hypothetical protein [Mycobacterium lacus]BBX96697.1 hypothetical protein MLAC_19910 [Mycobacterium lacus]